MWQEIRNENKPCFPEGNCHGIQDLLRLLTIRHCGGGWFQDVDVLQIIPNASIARRLVGEAGAADLNQCPHAGADLHGI